MAYIKVTAEGQSSCATVAVTVEAYHPKSKSKTRSSYRPRHSGKKKTCR